MSLIFRTNKIRASSIDVIDTKMVEPKNATLSKYSAI